MRLSKAISRLTVASERVVLCFVGVFNRVCLNRSIENGVMSRSEVLWKNAFRTGSLYSSSYAIHTNAHKRSTGEAGRRKYRRSDTRRVQQQFGGCGDCYRSVVV